MLQLCQKLMGLMEKQYQGRDGIMFEADNDREDKSPRFVGDVRRFIIIIVVKLIN